MGTIKMQEIRGVKWKRDGLWIVGIIVMALVVLAPQINYHAMAIGDDWEFQWNRFYEAAMQIKNGHFNFFQSIYAFRQSGRVVNAVYGSAFAYLNGFILILVKTWFRAQIISSFLCLLTAGSGMYFLARYCRVKRQLAFGAAVLYMGTPLVMFYVTDAALRGWGAALLPFTTIPLIRMVRNHDRPINPVLFGLAAGSLLAVQNFTALLYVLSAVVFFIPGLYLARDRYRTLLAAGGAVAIAVGLNAATLAALIDLHHESLVMPYRVKDLIGSASQLSLGNMTRLDFGLILSFVVVIQLVFAALSWKNLALYEKIINVDGLLFLWLSSPLFPWNVIGKHFPVIQTIQFPQRFYAVALTMIILGAVLSLQKLGRGNFMQLRLIAAAFISLAGLNLINGYTWVNEKASAWRGDQLAVSADSTIKDQSKIRDLFNHAYDQSHVFSVITKNTPDYLPVTQTGNTLFAYDAYKSQILNHPLKVVIGVNSDSQVVYKWKAKSRKSVLIPAIAYRHSTVMLNGTLLSRSEYHRSNIGALIVTPRKGSNQVTLGYQPSRLFDIAGIINILTCLALILYGGFRIFLVNMKWLSVKGEDADSSRRRHDDI